MTIKELRKSVNMTQSQFAEWLSTSIENIKNWERGKSQPSEMLLKLINYYVNGHKQGKQINIDNKKKYYILEHKTIYEHNTRLYIYESKEELEKNIKLWHSNDYDIIVRKFEVTE